MCVCASVMYAMCALPVNLLVVGVCVYVCVLIGFLFFACVFTGPSNCGHNFGEPCLDAHLF